MRPSYNVGIFLDLIFFIDFCIDFLDNVLISIYYNKC